MSHSAAAEAIFNDITQTFSISFVPDLFESMRNRPAYLATAWELFKEEMDLERLDRRTKLIIALAITTNEAETYFISALPQAFRLGALDQATHDKVLSAIRFFRAFDQYLSGITPAHVANAATLVSSCLPAENQSWGATQASRFALTREKSRGKGSWIGGLIVMIVVLSWAVALYWFI